MVSTRVFHALSAGSSPVVASNEIKYNGYMDEVTKAYIAGLFDGEGSVSFVWRKATKNGKKYGRLLARISQNERSVLEWVREVVGLGSVHTRKQQKDNWARTSDYVVAYEAARQFLAVIRPYLRVKGGAVDEKLALDTMYVKRRHGPVV